MTFLKKKSLGVSGDRERDIHRERERERERERGERERTIEKGRQEGRGMEGE